MPGIRAKRGANLSHAQGRGVPGVLRRLFDRLERPGPAPLGLDGDSGLELLAADFNERDPAVKAMLSRAIDACVKHGKYIGICGQGPSDHPDFTAWLVDAGVTSLSLNPNTVIATWTQLGIVERKHHEAAIRG
jgi:hypothetical protein